jgi:hypothetical protein
MYQSKLAMTKIQPDTLHCNKTTLRSFFAMHRSGEAASYLPDTQEILLQQMEVLQKEIAEVGTLPLWEKRTS